MGIEQDAVFKIVELDMNGIDDADQDDAKQEVADYLREQFLADLGRAVSPVTGEDFTPLSKAYAKEKAKVSSKVIPNMELTGAMLDALICEPLDSDQVQIGWLDPDQAIKAYAHTEGDGVPKRPLIPAESRNFRPEIMEGIAAILDGYRTPNAD